MLGDAYGRSAERTCPFPLHFLRTSTSSDSLPKRGGGWKSSFFLVQLNGEMGVLTSQEKREEKTTCNRYTRDALQIKKTFQNIAFLIRFQIQLGRLAAGSQSQGFGQWGTMVGLSLRYLPFHYLSMGACGSIMVKALCYKPGGRGFETR
jgi:hypothetical protein